MNYLKISVSLLILFLLANCNSNNKTASHLETRNGIIYESGSDKPFTGTEKAKVNNSIMEYEIVNGVKQGNFKMYYLDSTLLMSGTMDNNKNVGKWQYFYPNGNIESEGEFVNNAPNGKWSWYYESGKIREEGIFENGIRIGEWKFYNELGKIDSTLKIVIADSLKTNQ